MTRQVRHVFFLAVRQIGRYHERSSQGAFGAHPGHDAHVLSTLSAIQVLVTHDALGRIDAPRVIDCTSVPSRFFHHLIHAMLIVPTVILGLQQPSGIFAGDAFGETDTRFLYCAVSALSLLGALDRFDRARTVAYLAACRNFDGGFGRIAGAESHAAQGACLVLSIPLPPPPGDTLRTQYGCVRLHLRFSID